MRYSNLAITVLTVTTSIARAAPAHQLRARTNGLGGVIKAAETVLKEQESTLSRLAQEAERASDVGLEESPLLKQALDDGARGSSEQVLLDEELVIGAPDGVVPKTGAEIVQQGQAFAESLSPAQQEDLARRLQATVSKMSAEGQEFLKTAAQDPATFQTRLLALPGEDQDAFRSISQQVAEVDAEPWLMQRDRFELFFGGVMIVVIGSVVAGFRLAGGGKESSSSSAGPTPTVTVYLPVPTPTVTSVGR